MTSADEFVVRMSKAIEKHTDSSQASATNETGAASSDEAKEAAQTEAEKSMKLEDKVAL